MLRNKCNRRERVLPEDHDRANAPTGVRCSMDQTDRASVTSSLRSMSPTEPCFEESAKNALTSRLIQNFAVDYSSSKKPVWQADLRLAQAL